MIKDLESVEKKYDTVKRNSRSGITDSIAIELSGLEKVIKGLNEASQL